MKRHSLKSELYLFLKSRAGQYVNGGELERFAESLGFKGSNASRRLRELVGEKIKRELKSVNGGVESVYYKYEMSNYERMDYAVKSNQAIIRNNQLKLI